MRFAHVMMITALAVAINGAAWAADIAALSPITNIPDVTLCGAKSPLDRFHHSWYCDPLTKMREPKSPFAQARPTKESFRLIWLRSFHQPMVIRIEISTATSATLTASTLASPRSSSLGLRRTVNLNATEIQNVQDAIDKADFWNLPSQFREEMGFGSLSTPINPLDEVISSDGAAWIVEGLRDGDYHLIGDNPLGHDSPPFVIGVVMLNLAHDKIPQLAIDPLY